jgi:hypothetical protein
LESLIYDAKGDAWLNSLRRFVLSAMLVPTQQNLVVNVPMAVGTNRGVSNTIPIQGPEDAKSELHSLIGVQGVRNIGLGTITSAANAVTGTSTAFTAQLHVGSTILTAAAFATVTAIADDTHCTTNNALGAGGVAYFFTTVINADARDNLFVEIEDPAWRRMLMNRDVPVQHVFGTAQKPLYMRESILLEGDQSLLFRFYNYSTAAPASITPMIEARKWQVESLKRPEVAAFIEGLRKRKLHIQPYWLTLDNGYIDVAASDMVTQFFTITGDIAFVAFNLYGYVSTTGTLGDTQEYVALEFFDAKTNRALQIQPTTLNTACGTAFNPFHLPAPLICEPASQIRVRIRNLVTNATVRVFLTFHGVACYMGIGMKGGALTDPAVMAEAAKMYQATMPVVIPASPRG